MSNSRLHTAVLEFERVTGIRDTTAFALVCLLGAYGQMPVSEMYKRTGLSHADIEKLLDILTKGNRAPVEKAHTSDSFDVYELSAVGLSLTANLEAAA